MVAEECPKYSAPGIVLNKSQRKLSNERMDAYALAELEHQRYDMLWKPVSSVRLRSAATSSSSLSSSSSDAGPALLDRMGTIHTLPLPADRTNIQILNHLHNHHTMTTKPGLYRSLTNYYRNHGLNPHHVLPETFLVVSSYSDDPGWVAFATRFKEIATKNYVNLDMPIKQCTKNMWIVKPPDSNQGRGIRVFSSLSKIKKFVSAPSPHEVKAEGKEWVVQKYLESPMLLWGRKFDLRIWVLVTPNDEICVYRQGYLRTSSSPFTTDTIAGDADGKSSGFIHLTNFCMQKNSPSVGKYEDGNTLSYIQFQEYVNEHYEEMGMEKAIDVSQTIMPKIYTLIVDAVLAGRNACGMKHSSTIKTESVRKSFELFGYDFMVDEDLRPWLIEVNTNPYLGTQNKWHGELVEVMVEDLITKCVDPLFPKPTGEGNHVFQWEEEKRDYESSQWRQGFEVLWTPEGERGGGRNVDVGVDTLEKREEIGLGWYYHPREIPPNVDLALTKDLRERRKHLSSRDKNVIKAKERVRNREREMRGALQTEEHRREQSILQLRKLREQQREHSRAALRAVLAQTSPSGRGGTNSSVSPATSPVQHTSPFSTSRRTRGGGGGGGGYRSSSGGGGGGGGSNNNNNASTIASKDSPHGRQCGGRRIKNKSPQTSPLRGRSKSFEKILNPLDMERERKEERRKREREYSQRTRASRRKGTREGRERGERGGDDDENYHFLPTRSTSASSTNKKIIGGEGVRRNTFNGKKSVGMSSPSSSSSSSSFLPKVENSSSSFSSSSSSVDFHELVQSPPCRLTEKELDIKRNELLARAKFECEQGRRKLEVKRNVVLTLKRKQQSWVEENLGFQKDKVEEMAMKLKLQKEKIEIERKKNEEIEKDETQKKRMVMRKKWLQRQREKREREEKHQRKVLEEQQMLDTLSQKRECDNQVKYEEWKRQKAEEKKMKRIKMLEDMDNKNIMNMEIRKMNALESKRREGRRRGGGERGQSQHRGDRGRDRQQGEQEEQQQIQNQQQQMQGLHGFDDQKEFRRVSLREMEKRHENLKKIRLKKQRKLRRKELEEEARRSMRRVGRVVEVMGKRSRREQRMDNGQF